MCGLKKKNVWIICEICKWKYSVRNWNSASKWQVEKLVIISSMLKEAVEILQSVR